MAVKDREVTLREAASEFGISPSYMQVLPSRHPADSARPFPAAIGQNEAREKTYPYAKVKAWIEGRNASKAQKVRPPECMSTGQWSALVRIADRTVTQQHPGKRYWGTHPIRDDQGEEFDQRVVGSLMVEGYVRGVGRRGRLRYEVTADGKEVLTANPDWVERARTGEVS